MRASSSMIFIFQTCTILTFALTSSAARYANSPATVTAPPSTATLQARAFGDLVLGACGPFDRYVKVSTGANCESLAKANGITIDDLLLMNPMLDKYCDNMKAGNSYCVGALGSEKNGAPPPPPPPPPSSPPPATTTPPPPPPPPPPAPTSPAVWNKVCTTTPATCFSGATGTDHVSYTTGCCNGCGKGGTCELEAPPGGPNTFRCACGGVFGRSAFNGLVENGTWTA